MPVIVFVLYGLACALCGYMGRHTTIGFIGHFLLALLLTPVIDFLIQAVGRPSARQLDKIEAAKSR